MTKVVDSRESKEAIPSPRRECLKCEKRSPLTSVIDDIPSMVVKKRRTPRGV